MLIFFYFWFSLSFMTADDFWWLICFIYLFLKQRTACICASALSVNILLGSGFMRFSYFLATPSAPMGKISYGATSFYWSHENDYHFLVILRQSYHFLFSAPDAVRLCHSPQGQKFSMPHDFTKLSLWISQSAYPCSFDIMINMLPSFH